MNRDQRVRAIYRFLIEIQGWQRIAHPEPPEQHEDIPLIFSGFQVQGLGYGTALGLRDVSAAVEDVVFANFDTAIDTENVDLTTTNIEIR